MNYGKRFQLYRRKKQLTQKDAADELGVKPYQLANYESNRSEPSIKVLIGMSKLYGVSIEQLLGVTQETFLESNEDLIKEQLEEREEFRKALESLLKKYGLIDKG